MRFATSGTLFVCEIQSCAKQIAKIGSLRAINFIVFVYFRQIFKYVANIFRMMPLWPREFTKIYFE